MAENGKVYTVSLVGQVYLVIAICLYLLSLTFEPSTFNNFVTMIAILIVGMVLAFKLVGVKFVGFSWNSFLSVTIATISSMVSIYFVNQVVPFNLELSPIGAVAYGILAGVTEEWFFRLFFCAWVDKLTGQGWLAILLSALVWSIFHTARYGYDLRLMFLVFLAGLPLGYFCLAFRSADGNSFGHGIMNAIALGA